MITITVNGADYEVPSNASDTNWAANQVAWEQAISSYANGLGSDAAGWAELLLEIGKVPFDVTTFVPAYSKRPNGDVVMRGQCSGPGMTVGTLASGSRPNKTANFVCIADGGVANVSIDPAGVITATAIGESDPTTQLSLDGIVFSTVVDL